MILPDVLDSCWGVITLGICYLTVWAASTFVLFTIAHGGPLYIVLATVYGVHPYLIMIAFYIRLAGCLSERTCLAEARAARRGDQTQSGGESEPRLAASDNSEGRACSSLSLIA